MPYKSNTPPLCLHRGRRIPKFTKINWVETKRGAHMGGDSAFSRYVVVETAPKTKGECQKLTNEQVVSVKRSGDHIRAFGTWDGESYIDKFFCTGDHAKRFAYMAARKLYG